MESILQIVGSIGTGMIKQVSLILAATVLFFVACTNKEIDKVKISSNSGLIPTERGINIGINYTDSGYLKARVFAPLLERYSSEELNYSEMNKGITAYFYKSNGKVSSFIKAKYARRDERNLSMLVKNNVVVVNDQGDTIQTDELIWDETRDLISTDKYVSIHSKDKIIYGTGLETKTDFKQPKIFNIKGIVYLNK